MLPRSLGTLALVLAPGAASIPAVLPQEAFPQDGGEEAPLQGFSIPETRVALALSQSADLHIAAGRWTEAISDLQEILEEHMGELLGATRPSFSGRPSQMPVHRGASSQARERLEALPAEAHRIYRDRFESTAAAALARARASSDPRALSEVARRWPLTLSCELAWWSLGDLELELGNSRAALDLWSRALARRTGLPAEAFADPAAWSELLDARSADADAGMGGGEGVRTRAILAQAILRADTGALVPALRASRESLGEMRLPGEGEGLGPPPGADADEWPRAYKLPEHKLGYQGCFHAVRSGDTVLASNSMRLVALNAYSGTLRWDSGEPAGWEALSKSERDKFFAAFDLPGGPNFSSSRGSPTLIAPAASANIAVAALQIPVAHFENDDFQRIPIMRKLPDRRLFAFDLETGRMLWSHTPPPDWDGDTGSFTERMSVAGPPVIAGSRVLVPEVRMQGRIGFHVGCFRVDTGEVLWTRALISGQRETNMFGRAMHEFSAPPLRVEGDRVIALTQLGTLAAIDLYTGEILWETLYDQIPLPKTRQYEPTPRQTTWRNAPPVTAAGMVIAAPADSEDLIGVDLESGALVWSLRRDRLRAIGRREADIDLLIGADERTVYLAGDAVVALEAPSGLDRSAPTRARWVFEDESLEGVESYRPVLARDRVVVPTNAARIDIDRITGKRIEGGAAWRSGRGGNLLVDDGALFRLERLNLTGYFEWDALLSRARSEVTARPDDPAAALALGQLLANRGIAEWTAQGRTDRAKAHLVEAHELLESVLARSQPQDQRTAIAAELHDVLRAEARVRADLADAPGALQVLRQARSLAPSREALRDTLLEELALLRGRDAPGSSAIWLEVLAALEEACGDLAVSCEVRTGDPGLEPEPAADAELRFVPVVGSTRAGDSPVWELPVGLWARLERARALEAEGDVPRVFEELHAILAEHGDVELPEGSASDFAAAWIGRLLRAGRTTGYEAFERAAGDRLAAALADHDGDRLEEIARLFPHSRASEAANDTLLEWARADSDADTVARIVLSELADPWRPADASEREVRLVLKLGSALERAGNREVRPELVRTLARNHGELRSDIPEDEGKTLSELARLLDASRAAAAPEPPRLAAFDASVRTAAAFDGEHEILGLVPGEPGSTAAPRLLIARAERDDRPSELFALSADDPRQPVWTFALARGSTPPRWSRRTAFAAGRVLLALDERVIALSGDTGELAWTWTPHHGAAGAEPKAIVEGCGIALVLVLRADETFGVHALDAHGGTEIWDADLSDLALQPEPLVDGGRVVFLPDLNQRRVLVRDLFTGRTMRSFEIPFEVKDASFHAAAWIEDGKLIAPSFLSARAPERNRIAAFDLETGLRAWTVDMPSDGGIARQLCSILQHGSQTFLLLRTAPGPDQGEQQGEIRELRTNIPALSNPIGGLRLAPSDLPVGVGQRERVQLASPHLFLRSPSRGGATTSLRMIHLPYGEQWTHDLPVPDGLLYNPPMPLPALSETTVAFAYTESRERRGRTASKPVTSLLFVDRLTGAARDSRILADAFGKQDAIDVLPFGRALIVRGSKRLEVLQ